MLIVTLILVWLAWHFRNAKGGPGTGCAWLVLLAIAGLACVAAVLARPQPA